MNSNTARLLLLVSSLQMAGCAGTGQQTIPPVTDESQRLARPFADLRRAYTVAKSQFEGREICLRAIDQGIIKPGEDIVVVDQVFDTDIATRSRTYLNGRWVGLINFLPPPQLPPTPAPSIEPGAAVPGRIYPGWYFDIEFSDRGSIIGYRLTNIHKGFSRGEEGAPRFSVTQLAERYRQAKTVAERRQVCLDAIDGGVIQTIGQTKVQTVDAIFGTHLAADLPSGSHRKVAMIDLSGVGTSQAGNATMAKPKDWFLAIEYYRDAVVEDYYLTNADR